MMAGYGRSPRSPAGSRSVRCPGRGDRGTGPRAGGAVRGAAIGKLESTWWRSRRRSGKLRRLLGRNSGNSRCRRRPMTCRAASRRRGSRRGGGKRKPGKQPGSPGSHLAWRGTRTRGAAFPGRGVRVRRGPGLRGGPGRGRLATSRSRSRWRRAGDPARPARGGLRLRAGAPGGPPPGSGAAGHGHLRPAAAGLVRVPDRGARGPGAPLRGADRGADRRESRRRGSCTGCSAGPPPRSPRRTG